MLITFSGLVGSGKSTGAKQVLRCLGDWGYTPYYVRFRLIRWYHLLIPPVRNPWQAAQASSHAEQQDVSGYNELQKRAGNTGKRLSFCRFIGYWLLIMRFRLFLAVHFRNRVLVLNRYFYDCFARFKVADTRERRYLSWLFAALPKPDLAFLMVISPETSWRRRPAYDYDELRQLAENYENLQKYVGELTVITTDNPGPVNRRIEQAVRTVFHPKRMVALVLIAVKLIWAALILIDL
jgi:thymidylate kinase